MFKFLKEHGPAILFFTIIALVLAFFVAMGIFLFDGLNAVSKCHPAWISETKNGATTSYMGCKNDRRPN